MLSLAYILITEKKYEHFNQYNLVYKHNTLSNNNLIELKNLGYRSFYFNLGKIFIIFNNTFDGGRHQVRVQELEDAN